MFIQDGKWLIFITFHFRHEEKPCCRTFQPTQAPPLIEHALFFLRGEKNQQGSDVELTEQPLACSVPTICSDFGEASGRQDCNVLIIYVSRTSFPKAIVILDVSEGIFYV